ncbi:MAG: hypothetical protein ACK4RV_00110 [Caulobacter sp.]
MRLASSLAAPALALIVAACGQSAPQPAPTPAKPEVTPSPQPAPASKPSLALDPEGVRLVSESGSTSLLAFDRPTEDVVQVLTRLLGAPANRVVNSDCGAGPTEIVQWSDGFSALFLDAKFTGWSVDRESADLLTTMNGVGVGSTQAELAGAFSDFKVEETTLGQEFSAGGYYGILDKAGADGRVETMWAGTSCVFR